MKTQISKPLSKSEEKTIIKLCHLNADFFKGLTFVKRNLMKFENEEYGNMIESYSIEDCNKKLVKESIKLIKN